MKLFQFFFVCLLTNLQLVSQTKNSIEQLEESLKNAKTIPEKITITAKLAIDFNEIDLDKSKKYLGLCANYLKMNPNDSLKLKYLNAKANNYFVEFQYDSSLKIYVQNAVLSQKLKRLNDYGLANLGIATCFRAKQMALKSLSHYDIALKAFEKIGNKRLQTRALKEKGSFLIQSKSFESGRKIFKECAKISMEIKDTLQVGMNYGSIGWSFRNESKNDSAIFYLAKASKIFEATKSYNMLPIVTTEIGRAFAESNNYETAIKYYNQAEQQIIEFKLTNNKHADALNNFKSQALIALKKYKEAIPYTEKALQLSLKTNDEEETQLAYYNLFDLNKQLKNYEKSVFYFEKYDSLRNVVEDKKERKNVSDIIEKYQTEKKEQQIKLQLSEISRKNQQLIGVGFLTIFLSFLGYLFYKKRQLQQEAKLLAEVANQQTLATQAVLDGEERERKRIAADLHDGIGQTIMALKMNLVGINNHITFENPKAKEIFEKAVDLANETAKEVRAISHQMMPNALIKSGLASAIREFLANLETQNLKINLAVNNLNTPLEPTIEKVLYRVIQEAVNNVIKHAKATELNIAIDKNKENVLAKIADNGQGFDTKRLENEGIGLKNIKDRIAYLKGDIKIESTKKSGTIIFISIPST